MKSVNGTLVFKIGKESIKLKVDNLIFIDDFDKNQSPPIENEDKGQLYVNKIFTQDGVSFIIEDEIKKHKVAGQLEGHLHDIEVYDESGNLFASAKNLSDRGNFKFIIEKVQKEEL